MMTKDKSIGAAFCDAVAEISKAEKVGILCAMEVEMENLLGHLRGVSVEEVCGFRFYEGVLGRTPVILVQCGVGKVNAARCTQLMIDRYAPSVIVNSGVAGALAEELAVGDVVIGTEFVQHDVDVSALGYARGYLCTGAEPDRPTVFFAEKEVVEKLAAAAQSVACGATVLSGRIASGDRFVGAVVEKKEIRSLFGALAVEMEGAAIAQTASCAGVPFAVLRVISDLADGSKVEAYERFEQNAAALSGEILKTFAKRAAER